jgi:diguanylate cyclase (GGDEF)-like protein
MLSCSPTFLRVPFAMTIRLIRAALIGGSAALALLSGPPAGAAAPTEPETAASLVARSALALRQDPETSRREAEQALALLQVRPDADLEIRARLVLCEYQAERNQAATEEQIDAIEARLPAASRAGLRAGLLTCRGELQETLGNNTLARSLYEQAASAAQSLRDDEMLAGALFSRGYLLGLQGDYGRALADLRQAQALYDKLAMPLHALTTLNSIAITYNRMGDYAQARDIYTRSLTRQRAAGMRREQVVTLHNLGRVAENLREWDQARNAFENSRALAREIGYQRGEAYALRGLATVATADGHPEAALTTLAAALEIQQHSPDARLGGLIGLTRGKALHLLGRHKEARFELLLALEVFRKADSEGDMALAYDELAGVDADLGDWRRAFQWQDAAKTTSEKLLRSQLDQRFATLKVEFDTASKEKENQALQKTNTANELALGQTQRAQNLQIAVIALTALLAALLATLAIHQRRSSLRMRELAMTDELTEVPNRRAVLGLLAPRLGNDASAPAALMILDIDHFKRINDDFGHPAGDRVLRSVAARLRAFLITPNFFGRIGGEEFLIVIPDCSVERAIAVAEELRLEISSIDTSGLFAERRTITASIGVTLSAPGDSPSTLLQRADAALYRAKRSGRNCVVLETAKAAMPRIGTDTEHANGADRDGVIIKLRQG